MRYTRITYILTILIISIILILNCAYYNTLFNAKRSYNDGIESIQKEPDKENHPQANKFFEQTIEKCWKLIELYSDKSKYADDALLFIVKSEYYLGKYTQAKLHANQFISKYPESDLIPESYLWLGKILLKENNVDQGKEYLNKCITISKKSRLRSESYYELGNIAFEDEDYLQAIGFFEKALNENIDEQYAAFVQFYLAESYFQQKKYNEAIERYKKVEKFSPSLDVEYKTKFNLGVSYAEIGKYQEALKILRKMLTAPRFKNFIPLINSEIAQIYYKQNKIQDSIDLYKKVVHERKSSPGTAIASFNLAKIYEQDIQNIDSAVYYYGEVKKIYAKYDSVEKAQNRHIFLSELKNIKDDIKRDQRLVFRLENDSYFRDSLYTAQYEDSILSLLGKKSRSTVDTSTLKIDTTNVLYKYNIQSLDSIKNVLLDSMANITNDTLKGKLDSSLAVVNDYIIFKAPKKEIELEKRKLPEIKEDLKDNKFHLAEFFLLQNQEYDSALYHYKDFLKTYEDSILVPKAIYSMYYIYSSPQKLNPTKRDSLEQILTEDYPNSQFTKEIMRKRGLLQEEQEKRDSLNTLGEGYFLKAEEYYSENKLDSALYWYRQTAALDSNLEWSAKAQLAIAWIYEIELHDIQQAVKEYTHLNEAYNLPEYQKFASNKIKEPVVETLLVNDDSLFAQQDSTSPAYAAMDTSFHFPSFDAEPSIGTEGDKSPLPSVAKSKQYREWRQYRSSNY